MNVREYQMVKNQDELRCWVKKEKAEPYWKSESVSKND